ncbi:pre-mRNA-splicing factor Syf2 [Anopheles arabiensis]|uniref:Pre-mRNA-splicing factor SYF2 n=6 Tax=gambiae species complex TaxID=44542 RepID=A0A1S4H495_ANOGA|nr:pre-mRNA-splicing factor Syf2 [Anopheles arabiensis]XP_040237696.1 pre-mRNA-splicing factor Syf2 [Anopheles coluzzii]XP_314488.5 pre-mRNA-splicing factor Syf2 [Anopheles gambiae]
MAETATTSSKTFAEKHAERMARLKQLHTQRNEARASNHQEVIAEHERKKLPANWESRQRQAEWLMGDLKARTEAEEKGLDYNRVKMLNVSAAEADRIDKLKAKKRNADPGFSDYEAQTARQYNRLVKAMPPRDLVKYEEQKEKYGDAFYGGPNVILQGLHKDTPAAIDNMVKDLEGQIAKRKKFSRRRTHNDDADIDYINEKNARFNKKLERFYGEHTAEIKQNLERGTAI